MAKVCLIAGKTCQQMNKYVERIYRLLYKSKSKRKFQKNLLLAPILSLMNEAHSSRP
jgi:ribosomal protein L28